VVTHTFNDYDGDSDRFLGVAKSFGGGRRLALEEIKKHMGRNWPDSMVQVREKHKPGHLQLIWGDLWWDVIREKVRP